jgi:hypothetical protein
MPRANEARAEVRQRISHPRHCARELIHPLHRAKAMRRKNTCQDPLTSKSARTLLSHCGDGVAVGSFRPQLAKRPITTR